MTLFISILIITIFYFPDFANALKYPKDQNLSTVDASFWENKTYNYITLQKGKGDINGDGYDDIIIGTYGYDSGRGKTYLFFGKPAGWKMDINLSNADASFIGEYLGDQSGSSIAIIGDINGDRHDDFLIGASYNKDGGSSAGKTYLILGKASGWTKNMSLSNADASFIGEDAHDFSGDSVAGAGDVNGDGYEDIIIGAAEKYNDDGRAAGKTYIIFGKPSGWIKNSSLSNADASYVGEYPYDYSGISVAGAGDINGDGYDDILIGAFQNNDGGIQHAGQTYLIFGKALGWAKNVNISQVDASFIGEQVNDTSGWVSGAGDVNDDGYDDILIGAPGNDDSGIDAGKTYLIFGKSSGWSMDTSLSKANASFIGENKNDHSGLVTRIGDVTGDGYDDMLIGAPGNDGGGVDAGKAYLILGKFSGWSKNIDLFNADGSFIGEHAYDYSGSVSGVGDVNGDGNDDIMIGAPGNNEGGVGAGQAYLIFPDTNFKPISIDSIKAYSDEKYSFETDRAFENDTIFIELHGTDSNPNTNDVTLIKVASSLSDNKGFIMKLIETEKNSGVYRGNFNIKELSSESNHWIKASIGESVTVTSVQDPTKNIPIAILAPLSFFPPTNRIFVDEDQSLRIHLWATVPEPLVWHEFANSDWLIWYDQTHNVSGIPNNGDVGINWINITVIANGIKSVNHNYTIIVNNTPPKIVTIDNTMASEDSEYHVDYNSTDDGQGTITWHLQSNASNWLSMNSSTGYLFGKPLNEDVGKYYVNVSVDDGNGGWDYSNFTLTVVNTNDVPVITSTDNDTAYQDIQYSVQYTTKDQDVGDILTWSLKTNARNWLQINSTTGRLSGIPSNNDVGNYWVNVSVYDRANTYDFRNFTLTVVNINDPPKITSIPTTTAKVFVEYKYQVTAEDVDAGDVLTYLLDAKPIGMAIDNQTGLIRWTPTGAQKGNITIIVRVTDGKVSVFQMFNISVPNHKPLVLSIPDQMVRVGDSFKYQINANDSDLGDVLNYSIIDGPTGMSISSSGLIAWTPTKNQTKMHTISIKISDDMDDTTIHFNISVKKRMLPLGNVDLDTFISAVIMIFILIITIIVVVYEWWRRTNDLSSQKIKKIRNASNKKNEQSKLSKRS